MKEEQIERRNFLISTMLDMLAKESEQILPRGLVTEAKGEFLSSLMIMRPPVPLDPTFEKMQDELLTMEKEGTIVDVEPLKYYRTFCHYKGDMFKLNADMVIVFSTYLLGSGRLDQSTDNRFVLNAGLQIKEEISNQFKERGGTEESATYILKPYNLPNKYACKIVLNKQNRDLYNDALKCLVPAFEFASANKVKTIAFNVRDLIDLTNIKVKEVQKDIMAIRKATKLKAKFIIC